MKNLLLTTICLGLVLASCAPSPEIVATAMAQTQAALPADDTPASIPSATPEPPPSIPTETPTTSVPDLRTITAEPSELACTKNELPDGGSNYVTGRATRRDYNNEWVIRLVATKDQPLLAEYVGETQRITGWWEKFDKADNTGPGFKIIECIVEKYRTAAGAQLAVQEYNKAKLDPRPGYRILENPERTLGDVFVEISDTAYSGYFAYYVDFSYRNYRVTIIGRGSADLDDLYAIGEAMLEKLMAAPLSTP
jgi:hypothetical protein